MSSFLFLNSFMKKTTSLLITEATFLQIFQEVCPYRSTVVAGDY